MQTSSLTPYCHGQTSNLRANCATQQVTAACRTMPPALARGIRATSRAWQGVGNNLLAFLLPARALPLYHPAYRGVASYLGNHAALMCLRSCQWIRIRTCSYRLDAHARLLLEQPSFLNAAATYICLPFMLSFIYPNRSFLYRTCGCTSSSLCRHVTWVPGTFYNPCRLRLPFFSILCSMPFRLCSTLFYLGHYHSPLPPTRLCLPTIHSTLAFRTARISPPI